MGEENCGKRRFGWIYLIIIIFAFFVALFGFLVVFFLVI